MADDSPRRGGKGQRNATYYRGDLRQDLLEAALRVIESDGPSALTLRALARRLGVSHAAPANHFAEKSVLFTAIASDGFALLDQEMSAAVSALPPGAGAVQRLRAMGVGYMHFAVTHRAHFEVMWRNDLLVRDDPHLAGAGEATLTQLTNAVHAAQQEGWAPHADPRTVAYLAWSTMHGLASLWLGGPLPEHDDRPFDQVAGSVADLLSSALAAAS